MRSMLRVRLTSSVRAWIAAREGVAAIEFGLLAPILFLMAVISIDLGQAVLTQLEMTRLAKTTSNYAMLIPPTSDDLTDIETAAMEAASDKLNTRTLTITASRECECLDGSTIDCDGTETCADSSTAGTYVTVVITAEYEPYISYPGIEWPLELDATAIVRVN